LKNGPRYLARFSEVHFYDIFHYTPFRFELIYRLGIRTGIGGKLVIHFPLPDERRKAFDFVERDIQKFQSLEDMEGGLEIAFDNGNGDVETGLENFSNLIFSERQDGNPAMQVSIDEDGKVAGIQTFEIDASSGDVMWVDAHRMLDQSDALPGMQYVDFVGGSLVLITNSWPRLCRYHMHHRLNTKLLCNPGHIV